MGNNNIEIGDNLGCVLLVLIIAGAYVAIELLT